MCVNVKRFQSEISKSKESYQQQEFNMIYSEEFSAFLKQMNISPTSAERSMDIGSGTLTKALKNQ